MKEVVVQCYHNEKLSMSAMEQKLACSKKWYLVQLTCIGKKTKKFETSARNRKTTPIEDKVICNASKRNPFFRVN